MVFFTLCSQIDVFFHLISIFLTKKKENATFKGVRR